MKTKAVFLDRDGVIIKDRGYIFRPEDVIFNEGIVEGLNKLQQNGFRLIIITNQSGIGRGLYKESDYYNVRKKILEYLSKNGIKITEEYYCPHSPEENCECRKPKQKFIQLAQKRYSIDIKNSFVIGDKPTDIQLAKNAGSHAVYMISGQETGNLNEARKLIPDYISAEFERAADFILFGQDSKIVNREELPELLNTLRKKNKRIVTLNGTFDILHKGHDFIISEAKKQGDILIVGVNSDSSVKSNKGEGRPINNEQARAKMIANYKEVNFVTIFDEKTPIEMLQIIKPDIHVNGSEYGKNCIEAPTVKKYGGKIKIVKRLPALSSSKILSGENLG
jgi:rfaE bifunctional protein nucleotidyltransferase chain/domain